MQILLHLAEPILYILAVCAENEYLHGYLQRLPKLLEWYCNVNFQRCGALAKIILSILCKSGPVEFELDDQEVNFIYELLSSSIYKQENQDQTWIAYTTDSNDSIYYFVTFCLHLVINMSNAIKLLKAGILDCISYLLQHYKQECLLKTALQLLTKLSAHAKISSEIKDNHSGMIIAIQQLMQKDSMRMDAFYCLLTLGIDVHKITGQTSYVCIYVLRNSKVIKMLLMHDPSIFYFNYYFKLNIFQSAILHIYVRMYIISRFLA